MEAQDSGRDLAVGNSVFVFDLLDFSVEPKSFDEAFNRPNFEHRIKWSAIILKELKEVFDNNVYEVVKKSELPNGWTCINNKWVLKMKLNGFFSSAVGGLWFQSGTRSRFSGESLLPVVNDVTLFCLLR
jgi:hypothetical protein